MLGKQSAVDLGGVLRASVGVVHAAQRRSTSTEGGLEGRQRQSGVDRTADRIADHPARPGIEDGGEIDEAGRDRDVGEVGDPERFGASTTMPLARSGKIGGRDRCRWW